MKVLWYSHFIMTKWRSATIGQSRAVVCVLRENMHINSVVIIIIERSLHHIHYHAYFIHYFPYTVAIMHRTSGRIRINELDFICLIWLWWCGMVHNHTHTHTLQTSSSQCRRQQFTWFRAWYRYVHCLILYTKTWYVRFIHKLHYNICYATIALSLHSVTYHVYQIDVTCKRNWCKKKNST